MVEILVILYSLLCFIVFKVFKVPLNKWTGTTAVLIGFISVSFLLLMMGMYHPFTKEGRIYAATTPILPTVKGRVIEVPVKAGDRVKEGDILFSIDPEPFQHTIERLEAELKLAQSNLEDATALYNKQLSSEKNVELARAKFDSLTAQLATAKFELAETEVKAPADGYVAQVRLRPGALAVPMPFSPLMTFVQEKDQVLLGGFQQNPLQNIKTGYESEVIFVAIPGKVFKATVAGVGHIMAQGQLLPSGQLISFDKITSAGRVPVAFELEEDLSSYNLPPGVKVYIAVYSEKWHPVAIIRKVMLRMMSWENWLFSFIS